MDIEDQKRIARRNTLGKRAKLGHDERRAAETAVTEAVMGMPEIGEAKTVMAFASFGTEIPTDGLVDALLTAGRRVLMPVVRGTEMRAAEITGVADLAPGYRGIREPAAPPISAVAPEADVILVPGVAFDARGARLGYGGGFYDAFLADATGLRVGLCFDCQVIEAVPSEPHDRPVQIIVTETRILRPA